MAQTRPDILPGQPGTLPKQMMNQHNSTPVSADIHDRLPRSFFTRDAREVARDLLGRILVTHIDGVITGGVIIETEAYLGDGGDEAAHTHRGPTPRNRPMFLIGGHTYVYFIYGMYHCFNVVTGIEGNGEAVLLRGVEPLVGIEAMRRRRARATERDIDLANGPGKLTIAMGIGPAISGVDLTIDKRVWISAGTPLADDAVAVTPRIGITKSAHLPWRWLRR